MPGSRVCRGFCGAAFKRPFVPLKNCQPIKGWRHNPATIGAIFHGSPLWASN